MKKLLALFLFLAVSLATPAVMKAQDASSMTGSVVDATGAAVPGVTVTLTNTLTGTKYTQTSSKSGVYQFLNVAPGSGYTAVFSKGGFAGYKVDNITLNVGVTRTQNAHLSAGANEVVEISAGSQTVTLDTTDASIGSNVDVKSLNQLPVYDRTTGISTLFNLQPGVDNTQLGGSGSVTGARTDQNSMTVDGLDVNDIAAGGTYSIIGAAPVDSVEQFTGTVAGLVPSLGTGSGGQFQLVTKSGTNQFHGNINEYHRDTTTVANTYFNNNLGLPRTPLIRNQFGGNIGGPVIIPHLYNGKDKLFFFFDFADSRIIQSNTAEPTVPLTSLTSATAPTLNYINNGPGCGDTSRLNNAPTCISTLSAAQVAALDPTGTGFNTGLLAYIKNRYPAPNDPTHGDGVNTEGLRFTYPEPVFETTYVGRVDYNVTPTNKIYGRVTINRTSEVYQSSAGAPEFPGDPASLTEVDHSYGYVVSDVWTIGKNKVNQFYYGDNISKLSFPTGDFPTSPASYSFSGISNPYGTYNSQKRRVPIPVVRDDFNWQVKSHSLTMGGLFKFIKTNSNSISDFNFVGAGLQGSALSGGLDSSVRPNNPLNNAQTINANSQVALNDYDSLFATSLGVIGTISSNFDYNAAGAATPQGAGGPRAYRYFETEAYFGDTWRVNKQLTFTYGLRYQYYTTPYEVHGDESVSEIQGLGVKQSTFNQIFNDRLEQNASGVFGPNALPFFQEVLGGKANNGPAAYSPDYKDLAPRFAFAYNPKWSPKTVINGSASIVYDRTVINAINFLQDQLSFLFFNSVNNQFGSSSGAVASLAVDPRLNACTSGSTGCAGPKGLSYVSANNPVPAPIGTPYVPYVAGGVGYGLAAGQTGFVIDPTLRDPYTIDLNFGVQRELPWHTILKVNYVGRMGRRLLADADAGQVLNFPDNLSGQGLSSAFGSVTQQLRAHVKPESTAGLTPQPWFEDIIGQGNGLGNCAFPFASGNPGTYANCTSFVADYIGQLGNRGDIGDSFYLLAAYGIIPPNVGTLSQFGSQVYLTNKGSSNYNALLFQVSKNLSQGLKFDFNYTLAHSIDNNSQAANNNALYNVSGIICDVTKPRACRGSSDFDVRQEITGDFIYDLPFGHNKTFFANSGTLVNEVIGGWSLSGIPSYRTGLSVNILSDAFNASFDAEDPAIFTGKKSDLKSHVNNVQGTVYNFAGGAAGAAKVYSEFRGPIGLEYGQRNLFKGPGAFDLDMGLGKVFPIYPAKDVNLVFRADAFNLPNHPNFSAPGGDIVNNASPFGQISSTIATAGIQNGYRVAQFSLRLQF